MGKTLRSVALMAALVSSSALADLDPKVQALLNNIDIRTLNAEVAPTADGKGLVISGRWAYRINSNATTNAIVNGISNVGAVVGLTPSNPLPYCIFDSPATIVIPPGFAVSTPSSGGATRPTFKIAEYQKCMADATITDKTKCLIKTGQTIAVGSSCLAAVLKGTPPNEYHQVGDNAMSICKATPARVDFDKEEWAKFGDWLAKKMKGKENNITDAEKAACGVVTPTPTPAPTPVPVPVPVTTLGTKFCLLSDDNAELLIDSKSIVTSGYGPQACSSLIVMTPGTHSVVVKFVEFSGAALLHVLANGTPLAAAWNCSYFNNTTFSGAPALTRAETVLDFDWKSGSPDMSIAVDNWSAVCSGTLNVQ